MISQKQKRKKAHQQLAALSMASLLLLSLFSVLLITPYDDGVTGFAVAEPQARVTVQTAKGTIILQGKLSVDADGKQYFSSPQMYRNYGTNSVERYLTVSEYLGGIGTSSGTTNIGSTQKVDINALTQYLNTKYAYSQNPSTNQFSTGVCAAFTDGGACNDPRSSSSLSLFYSEIGGLSLPAAPSGSSATPPSVGGEPKISEVIPVIDLKPTSYTFQGTITTNGIFGKNINIEYDNSGKIASAIIGGTRYSDDGTSNDVSIKLQELLGSHSPIRTVPQLNTEQALATKKYDELSSFTKFFTSSPFKVELSTPCSSEEGVTTCKASSQQDINGNNDKLSSDGATTTAETEQTRLWRDPNGNYVLKEDPNGATLPEDYLVTIEKQSVTVIGQTTGQIIELTQEDTQALITASQNVGMYTQMAGNAGSGAPVKFNPMKGLDSELNRWTRTADQPQTDTINKLQGEVYVLEGQTYKVVSQVEFSPSVVYRFNPDKEGTKDEWSVDTKVTSLQLLSSSFTTSTAIEQNKGQGSDKTGTSGSTPLLVSGATGTSPLLEQLPENLQQALYTRLGGVNSNDQIYYIQHGADGSVTQLKVESVVFDPRGTGNAIYLEGGRSIPINMQSGGEYSFGSLQQTNNVQNKGNVEKDTETLSEVIKAIDLERTPEDTTKKPTPLLSQLKKFQNEYAQYQGLSGFSSLFFSQEFLGTWRNNVEKVFAETYLGTQYWTSELCSQAVDGKNDGFVFATTPQGLSELAAFVKATRTPEATDENGQKSYIYFIEVRVKNGNSDKDLSLLEKLKFNVELRGTKTVKLFSEKKEVKRGEEFKKLGKEAIVQDSNTRYDKICLVLDEAPYRWRLPGKEVCSPIPDSTGTPTSVAVASGVSGSSTPAAPEVNDI